MQEDTTSPDEINTPEIPPVEVPTNESLTAEQKNYISEIARFAHETLPEGVKMVGVFYSVHETTGILSCNIFSTDDDHKQVAGVLATTSDQLVFGLPDADTCRTALCKAIFAMFRQLEIKFGSREAFLQRSALVAVPALQAAVKVMTELDATGFIEWLRDLQPGTVLEIYTAGLDLSRSMIL